MITKTTMITKIGNGVFEIVVSFVIIVDSRP
jgi:hypothetical protein